MNLSLPQTCSLLMMPFSAKCGMIYRHVTEITEIDQPIISGLPKYWSQQPSFGRTCFSNQPPKLGPFLKRERTMGSWEELSLSEEVRSFKGVRILSKIEKARKTAFASWEDKAPWVATDKKQDVPTPLQTHFQTDAARPADNDAACKTFSQERDRHFHVLVFGRSSTQPSTTDRESSIFPAEGF